MQSFVVWSNEIEGRLDVFYYLPEFVKIERLLNKFECKRLKDISTDIKNGSTPTGGIFETEGIPYFRSQDFNLFDFEIKQFITPEFHKKLARSKVTSGDVLIAVVGATLGVTGYVPDGIKEANINQNVARVRIKDDDIDGKYLAIVLASNIGQKQLLRNATLTTQAYLNNQQLENIRIPFFPLSIQTQIVEIMQSAHNQKKQKEAEARGLLASIDDYVLDELGIKPPEVEDKMCFVVDSEEVRENRADAYYYQPRFTKLIEAIQQAPFKNHTLEVISTQIINGLDFREFTETGIPYLRVSNIKPNSFDISDVKFIPAFSISKDIELDSGDLLITRKGTYGNSVIVDDEQKRMVISSEIFRVVLKRDNVNPHYIAIYLNSNITKQLFNRISAGGIMGHLSQDALKNIQIILPPLEIQNKIAYEIKRRISEAERLKTEASKIIEEAKKKVEEMILGG